MTRPHDLAEQAQSIASAQPMAALAMNHPTLLALRQASQATLWELDFDHSGGAPRERFAGVVVEVDPALPDFCIEPRCGPS